MPGRRPKPAALRDLGGNAGHRPIKPEPALEPHSGRCPRELEGDARMVWERVFRPLCRLGVIKRPHEVAAVIACRQIADALEGDSRTRAEARQWLAMFGATPADAARLAGGGELADDPLAEFLRPAS